MCAPSSGSSSKLGKNSQNAPGHPLEMPPGGVWNPPRETALRHPGKTAKKTTLSNKSIITVPWGIARGNAGLGTSWNIAHPPSNSPLSSPKGDGFATTPARTAPVRASVMKFSKVSHSGVFPQVSHPGPRGGYFQAQRDTCENFTKGVCVHFQTTFA